MRKYLIYLLAVVLFLIGCGGTEIAPVEDLTTQDPTKLKIVTTIPPLYSLTATIAGENAEVTNLVPAGASVHTWEPQPSDIKNLAAADLLVTVDQDLLEAFLESLVVQSFELEVLATAEGLPLREIDEDHPHDNDPNEEYHDHDGMDPHVWLSTELVNQQALAIRDRLQVLDPQNHEAYQDGYQEWQDQLNQLKQRQLEFKDTVQAKPFIVFHDAYGYLFADLGIAELQKSAVEPFPGKEPSPAYLQELTEVIETEGVEIVFTEPQFSPDLVEFLVTELGVRTYELDPLGQQVTVDGYDQLMQNLLDNLELAFNNAE